MNNDELPQSNNNLLLKKLSSHSQTLKNNDDLEVFKKPTFTTKIFSEFEMTTKKTFTNSWKNRRTNLFSAFSNYIFVQGREIHTAIKRFTQKNSFVGIKHFFFKTPEKNQNFNSLEKIKFLVYSLYFRLFQVIVYLLGSWNYFLYNISQENICRNLDNNVIEILFLINFSFELLMKIVYLRSKITKTGLVKMIFNIFMMLVLFANFFFCYLDIIFLFVNFFRIFRLKKLLLLLKKNIVFKKYFRNKGRDLLKNKKNYITQFSFKKPNYKLSILLYESISAHILLIIVCANIFYLVSYIENKSDEFVDTLNIFFFYSRFANLTNNHFYQNYLSNYLIIIFLLINYISFIFHFLKLTNYEYSKIPFKRFKSYILICGNVDLKKLKFSFINNVQSLAQTKFIFMISETKLCKLNSIRKNLNSEINYEIRDNSFDSLRSLKDNDFDSIQKIYVFFDKNDKNTIFLYNFFIKKIPSKNIYVYFEDRKCDFLVNCSKNIFPFPVTLLKERLIVSTLLIDGFHCIFFSLMNFFADSSLKKSKMSKPSKNIYLQLRLGSAKITQIMENLKFSDVSKMILFCSFYEKNWKINKGKKSSINPIVVLGVWSKGEFIKNNLSNYVLRFDDDIYFMSNSVPEHKIWIENFSSKELNIFRKVEDLMHKKSSDDPIESFLEENNFRKNFFCNDSNKKTDFSIIKQNNTTYSLDQKNIDHSLNLPIFVNLFHPQKKYEKKIKSCSNHYILFINDQHSAISLTNMLRKYVKEPIFIFCENEFKRNLWLKHHYLREVFFFLGNYKIKTHLKCLNLEKTEKMFIHKSINKIYQSDLESVFLYKILQESYGCSNVYIDMNSNFPVELLYSKKKNIKTKSKNSFKIITDYSMYNIFLKNSCNEITLKFCEYFFVNNEPNSLNFFKIKINEKIVENINDVGSLLWKAMIQKKWYPLIMIRNNEYQSSGSEKYLRNKKLAEFDCSKFTMFDLSENLHIDDEIVFFSISLDEGIDNKNEQFNETNPISGLKTYEPSNNIDEKKTFINDKVVEEEKNEENQEEAKNKFESLLNISQIKEKIIFKDQIINALKFYIKVYEDSQ